MEPGTMLQSWGAQLDSSGRVLLPADLRQVMGWQQGTSIVLETDGDSLRLLSLERFTQEVQQLLSQGQPIE